MPWRERERRVARFVVTGILAAVVWAAAHALAHAVTPQPRPAPITVFIGIDAFRWDYADRPAAKNIRALAERGVRVDRLVPSFPSKTYPNFYTLVTGLYPEHHGIVGNVVYDSTLGWFHTGNDPAVRDGRWFGGEPIWATAEKQGVRTGVYFWPGDESEIGGVRPHWYVGFDAKVPRDARVKQVLDWLALPAAERPRLVTIYFEDVDNASHAVGPNGARTDSAIARVDTAVGQIVGGVARLGLTNDVNIVLVSDHGMAEVSKDRVVYLDDYASPDSFDVIDWAPAMMIAPKPGREAYVYGKLHGANPHFAVYRKADVPARLNFNSGSRLTAIIGILDEGWTAITHERMAKGLFGTSQATHGFDNQLTSMGATLIAAGPNVARGARVPPIQNVHVYSLLAALLGVKPAQTDGSPDSVRALLRR